MLNLRSQFLILVLFSGAVVADEVPLAPLLTIEPSKVDVAKVAAKEVPRPPLSAAAQSALEKARAQGKVPAFGEYAQSKLQPKVMQLLSRGEAACRTAHKDAPLEPLIIVLVLDDKGAVTESVGGESENQIHQCWMDILTKATYPAPPKAPFYFVMSRTPLPSIEYAPTMR